MRWRERELEAARGLVSQPRFRFLRNVRGMIVEGQFDRGISRIGGIKKLEKFDELTAAVVIPHQGMNFAREQIDPGQKADRAVALIFIITGERRMHARFGGQVRRDRRNRLDTGLLVIRDDRDRLARVFCIRCRNGPCSAVR
jgi:hypothetical protein